MRRPATFERLEVRQEAGGLHLIVHDRYEHFSGSTSWLLDRKGRGVVACDYTYTGPAMDTREAVIRFLMQQNCDEVDLQATKLALRRPVLVKVGHDYALVSQD